MKKHFNKLRMAPILLALLLFTNCQEDLYEIQEPQQAGKGKYTIYTGKEAKNKKAALITKLKKDNNKGLQIVSSTINNDPSLRGYRDIEPYIDDSMVIGVENESGVKHYTYRVNMPDASPSKFYNLVFSIAGNAERIMLLTYNLEERFAEDYGLTGDIGNMTGGIGFEIVTLDNDYPCGMAPGVSIPIVGGIGGPPLVPGGGTPGNGGTGGPTSPLVPRPGNPYNQDIIDAQYLQLKIVKVRVETITSGPLEGTMPTGGGDISNPGLPISTLSVPGYTTSDDPCADPQEIPIFEPSNPELEHKKNCDDLKDMVADNNLKSSLQNLQTKTRELIEYGYGIPKTPSGYGSPLPVSASPLNPSEINMPAVIGGNFVGAFHTHPDPFDGTFPMFSASDISYLYYVSLKHNSGGQPKDYNDYFLTLTTINGTYVLKINDYLKLINLLNSGNLVNLDLDLRGAYEKRKPEDSADGFTTDLLDVMKKYDIGVSLYEADNNLNWSEVELNDDPLTSSAYPLKSTPCI